MIKTILTFAGSRSRFISSSVDKAWASFSHHDRASYAISSSDVGGSPSGDGALRPASAERNRTLAPREASQSKNCKSQAIEVSLARKTPVSRASGAAAPSRLRPNGDSHPAQPCRRRPGNALLVEQWPHQETVPRPAQHFFETRRDSSFAASRRWHRCSHGATGSDCFSTSDWPPAHPKCSAGALIRAQAKGALAGRQILCRPCLIETSPQRSRAEGRLGIAKFPAMIILTRGCRQDMKVYEAQTDD